MFYPFIFFAFLFVSVSIIKTTLKISQRPILAQQKSIERAIDEEKLEAKARKSLAAEKKQRTEVSRKMPESATNEFEKRLKKVATRGGVY